MQDEQSRVRIEQMEERIQNHTPPHMRSEDVPPYLSKLLERREAEIAWEELCERGVAALERIATALETIAEHSEPGLEESLRIWGSQE